MLLSAVLLLTFRYARYSLVHFWRALIRQSSAEKIARTPTAALTIPTGSVAERLVGSLLTQIHLLPARDLVAFRLWTQMLRLLHAGVQLLIIEQFVPPQPTSHRQLVTSGCASSDEQTPCPLQAGVDILGIGWPWPGHGLH